jgi:hypothetical protein
MFWFWLAIAAVVAGSIILWLRRRRAFYRGAVQREGRFYCPHCDFEVSTANPMVSNFSGHRMGLHAYNRWCQVCEKNAEQHLIHRT